MTHFKARPTVYKGIQMRSRLEAGFAAWLDKFDMTWKYEPRAFASENGQYLPDFELPEIDFIGTPPAQVFVEIKPAQPDPDVLSLQRSIIKESLPDAQLVVVWPDRDRYRTMLIGDGFWDVMIWTVRTPRRLALDVEASNGPWHGDYWKPRPS